MRLRFILPLLFFAFLGASLGAQSKAPSCGELAKKHLSTLDKHLDLDYGQMKCLRDVAVRFCKANNAKPAATAAQRQNRLKKFRAALLDCLSARQQAKVKKHYRNKRDQAARRDLLQAFMEEFSGEFIVVKRQR